MFSSCLGDVLNATCILVHPVIVSVNLMGIVWSEDNIESLFAYFCVVLHPVDI